MDYKIKKSIAGVYRVEIGEASFSVTKYLDSWSFMFPNNDEGKRAIQELNNITSNVRTLSQAKEMVKQVALDF